MASGTRRGKQAAWTALGWPSVPPTESFSGLGAVSRRGQDVWEHLGRHCLRNFKVAQTLNGFLIGPAKLKAVKLNLVVRLGRFHHQSIFARQQCVVKHRHGLRHQRPDDGGKSSAGQRNVNNRSRSVCVVGVDRYRDFSELFFCHKNLILRVVRQPRP